MAGYAIPTTAHNNRALTPGEYEALMFPAMPDGVLGFPTDDPLVYADGSPLGLKVRANRYLYLRGLRYATGDVEQSITLAANTTSGTSRKDLIVARMTRNPWDVTIEVVPGTAVASPVTPSPTYGSDTSSGVWELPLASAQVNYNSNTPTVTPLHWYVGSDGQVRCTKDTRPPHEAGRTVWQHPEGRYLVSSGNQWLLAVEDGGKSSLQINTSLFVATHYVLYRRNGWAFAELTASRPGGQLNTFTAYKVATVPAGYRPPFMFQFAVVAPNSNQSVGSGAIQPDGSVYVNPGGKAIAAGQPFVCAIGSWPIDY